MTHPGPHPLPGLGNAGRSPPPAHDYGGLSDRQSPPFFPPHPNRAAGGGGPSSLGGFSRAVTPPAHSSSDDGGVDVEQLSPSETKSSRELFLTDLQQSSEKEKSASRPAASLFQPYLDVDKK
jgi:hypothetical protein